jgi:hypothetical protein
MSIATTPSAPALWLAPARANAEPSTDDEIQPGRAAVDNNGAGVLP